MHHLQTFYQFNTKCAIWRSQFLKCHNNNNNNNNNNKNNNNNNNNF